MWGAVEAGHAEVAVLPSKGNATLQHGFELEIGQSLSSMLHADC